MTATLGAAPIPIPKMAPQRRWRPGLVALAVALVATGGLSAAYAVTLVGGTNAYLAVGRDIQAGAQIATADLTVVRISTDPALRPMAAGRSGDVVGKYAAVALFAGALLTEQQIVDVPLGGAGTYLISIGLSQDKVPAQRIKAGVKVLLVATPADNVLSQPTTAAAPDTFPATVVDIAAGTQPGRFFVNVSVREADGPRIATLAAASRLVIVLAGG